MIIMSSTQGIAFCVASHPVSLTEGIKLIQWLSWRQIWSYMDDKWEHYKNNSIKQCYCVLRLIFTAVHQISVVLSGCIQPRLYVKENGKFWFLMGRERKCSASSEHWDIEPVWSPRLVTLWSWHRNRLIYPALCIRENVGSEYVHIHNTEAVKSGQ